jgi:DNA processing protein
VSVLYGLGRRSEDKNSETVSKLYAVTDTVILNDNYAHMQENGIRMLLFADEEYPERLRGIPDAPAWLFCKGVLPTEPVCIAVIGTRQCSEYGRAAARTIARDLTQMGIGIVSGMAAGADRYGHEGALLAGKTYAVLGCGADICYPRDNIELYQQILQKGGIISEYPPGSAPETFHFPMRNRIISGLSDGVFVSEAREKSGTLITVGYALDQGKEVYALPGRVTDKLSFGCNKLISQGAKLVTCAADIAEDFEYILPQIAKDGHSGIIRDEKIISTLANDERIVYACLDFEPKHFETLLEETMLPVAALSSVLFNLELLDLISEVSKSYYCIMGRS